MRTITRRFNVTDILISHKKIFISKKCKLYDTFELTGIHYYYLFLVSDDAP